MDDRVCAHCFEYGEDHARCEIGHRICQCCHRAASAGRRAALGSTRDDLPCPYLCGDGGFCGADIIVATSTTTASTASGRLARLVPVVLDSDEAGTVVERFRQGLPEAQVRNLYRVENPALRAVYEACRQRMTRETRVVSGIDVGANELTAFHATTRGASGGIVREGFDTHRAGKAHGTALGNGVYVATTSEFSHRYAREEQGAFVVLYCTALAGDCTGRDSNRAQVSSGKGPKDYQYVLHREQQVLPRYVIYYQNNRSPQGTKIPVPTVGKK